MLAAEDDYDRIDIADPHLLREFDGGKLAVIIPLSGRYHHRFTLYDPEAEVEFSDILEINTYSIEVAIYANFIQQKGCLIHGYTHW